MILLDTDVLTLLFAGSEKVRHRLDQITDEVAITVVTRIEILRGRFEALLKAADGSQLRLAMERLRFSEEHHAEVDTMPVEEAAAAEFDRLRQHKKLKKIGRGDLLIASIALADRAALATRNVKDFNQVPGLQVENWGD
jgi:tRNA(fMet)-specific endonuclease VapC